MTDEIDFDDEELDAASHWHGGQSSMLYAIMSTGALSRGTIRPRHAEGGSMTDEEWMIDLAERLESEAEDAAGDAAKQAKKAKGDEKKELLADREGLLGIAFKAGQFVRDAKRTKKASHATRTSKGKKSRAQLDHEIAQALAGRGSHSTKKSTLTVEQLAALRTFAQDNGRNWKRELNHAWSTGDWSHDYADNSGLLQQVRNTFGPSWLVKFSFNNSKTHGMKQ